MYRKKFLLKFVIASVLVGGINFAPVILNSNSANLQIASVAHAEIKDVTAKDAAILDFADESAEYTAKVQNVAKMRAIQRARERAGVYLKSFSRTVNGVLTADDISAYTSDKIEVSDVKFQKLFYQVKDVNGNLTGKIGFMYEATVTAKIDTTGLNDYIQKSLQEKQRLIERDRNLRNNVNEASERFENLRQNAQNKTSEQIKSELEQINKKVEETEKTSAEQNAPMIFSQPKYIGHAGRYPYVMQNPYYKGGYFFEGTSSNNGNILRMGKDGQDTEYIEGLASWGTGKNALYCKFKAFPHNERKDDDGLNFGGKDIFILYEREWRDIFKIDNNKDIALYLLYYYHPKKGCLINIIGCRKDGIWINYIDTDQIGNKFFNNLPVGSRSPIGSDNEIGLITYCTEDTIIMPYTLSVYSEEIEKGEFRFKWDEKAQWFGVEQVVY